MSRSRFLVLVALVASLSGCGSIGLEGEVPEWERPCSERVSDRVGLASLGAYWDVESMRNDGLVDGDSSVLDLRLDEGVPVERVKCLQWVAAERVVYFDAEDVVLDSFASGLMMVEGAEAGTRLDFSDPPYLPDRLANSVAAFDRLVGEGVYVGSVGQLPSSAPAAGVGVAPGDDVAFELVVVWEGRGVTGLEGLLEAALAESNYAGELDLSGVRVADGDGYAVLRAPLTGDPDVWHRIVYGGDSLASPPA